MVRNRSSISRRAQCHQSSGTILTGIFSYAFFVVASALGRARLAAVQYSARLDCFVKPHLKIGGSPSG